MRSIGTRLDQLETRDLPARVVTVKYEDYGKQRACIPAGGVNGPKSWHRKTTESVERFEERIRNELELTVRDSLIFISSFWDMSACMARNSGRES